MLRLVKNLSTLHRITSATRKSPKIVGHIQGAHRHHSDSTMSRVIPNKKQADAKSIDSQIVCGDESQTFKNLPPQRGLDSYQPTVLFRCDDYLVIDKPHGVRMNGEFEGAHIFVAANHL
jgi:23S rRNA-/tRNA-specific pseudouridylate synthase